MKMNIIRLLLINICFVVLLNEIGIKCLPGSGDEMSKNENTAHNNPLQSQEEKLNLKNQSNLPINTNNASINSAASKKVENLIANNPKTNAQITNAKFLANKKKRSFIPPAAKIQAHTNHKIPKANGIGSRISKFSFNRPPPIPNTIEPELRINIPQSFLGTCIGSKASEFYMSTYGISPCVGLTYFAYCDENVTFNMLAHFDSSHIPHVNTYIGEFISKIPAHCQDGKFVVNIADPMDNLPKLIKETLISFDKEVFQTQHLSKGFGVDLAIDTRDGKIQQYKYLGVDTPVRETILSNFFNRMNSNCQMFYIGKERLCRLEGDYKLAIKYDKNLLEMNPPYPDGFIYAFKPNGNSSNAESCRNEDIDLDS